MDEVERIHRLNRVLEGSGATVNDAFGIWALHSQLSDDHLAQLRGWADLQYLVAGCSQITDASLATICSFRRLTDLSLGGNAMTADALASCDWPSTIENLGLASIPLTDEAASRICCCSQINVLNVNQCLLSRDALARLAELPNLRVLEALGADSTPETSKALSLLHPAVLFRLRDGLWQNGKRRRPPFPSERV